MPESLKSTPLAGLIYLKCQHGEERTTLVVRRGELSEAFPGAKRTHLCAALEIVSPKTEFLRVISQKTRRSQVENKEFAMERFVELLRDAVRQAPIKKTRVSKGSKLRRLEAKKQQGMLIKERSKRVPIED